MDLLQEATPHQGLDVVRIVNLDDQGHVLLVQEVDDINWKLPGGKMHQGETVWHAAKRELKEELGYELSKTEIKNIVKALIPDSPNYRYIILTKMDPSKIKPTKEVAESQVYNLKALPDTKFAHHIASAVELVTA